MRTPVAVGVVGDGASAAALARAFAELPAAELRWTCTPAQLPSLLADESLDAVAVATPAPLRAGLARASLEAQKHVLVDDPIATTAPEADALLALAARRERRLVVANPLLFHPAVRKLKELIEVGRLGEVYYLHAVVQATSEAGDTGVLWSLGAPLVSAIGHLLDDEPVETVGRGDSYSCPGVTEVASCWFRFATGITASVHVSRLDARDARRIAVVGSRRTALFDDAGGERTLTVFERGTAARCGEIVSPRVTSGDPMRLQCESFVGAVRARHLKLPRRLTAAIAAIEELDRSAAAGAPPPLPLPARESRLQLVRP